MYHEESCDFFTNPNLIQKLQSIQPQVPLDVRGTILDEETEIIIDDDDGLPRGSCTGTLINNNNENDCKDDPDFRYKKKSKWDCSWIATKKK